jgi:hypothetical protein
MKITPKILSVPPYISTSWAQVHSIYMRNQDLVVALKDGTIIAIPALSPHEIETIFLAHTSFLENVSKIEAPGNLPVTPHSSTGFEGMSPLHFNLENMESFGSALQHNPAQANMPNLPQEILSKIAAIAKIVAPGEIQNLPKPEPHCNCPHCQIAKAIHGPSSNDDMYTSISSHLQHQKEEGEEEISEHDLSFQQWEIAKIGDQLYSVTNRLDTQESYRVYLGNPVGCTCGVSGCEHILTVLKS